MQEQEAIKINTLYFGELEVPMENIIKFSDGLLGFEHLKNYVLISDEESEPFKWLVSIEEPEIGFPIVDPWFVINKYNPGRGVDTDKDAVFSIVTLGNSERKMTANLKAPIIIDIHSKEGKQIILPSDKYSTNHVISANSDI